MACNEIQTITNKCDEVVINQNFAALNLRMTAVETAIADLTAATPSLQGKPLVGATMKCSDDSTLVNLEFLKVAFPAVDWDAVISTLGCGGAG